MNRSAPAARRRARALRARRGSAMLLALLLTVSLAALALSAIYMASGAALADRFGERDEQLRQAADIGLQFGRSRLNADPNSINSEVRYSQLMDAQAVNDADGRPLPNVRLDAWAGVIGNADRSTGRPAAIVVRASDGRGGSVVRRLDIVQESFARYSYWSNSEAGICFGSNDILFGPVFSNDVIRTCAGQTATFRDTALSAQRIENNAGVNGVFERGWVDGAPPMQLPNVSQLANLLTLAGAQGTRFVAPGAAGATNMDEVGLRLEFVSVDLNGDGDDQDADEGFLRAYVADRGPTAPAARAQWIRAEYARFKGAGSGLSTNLHTDYPRGINCGVWVDRELPGPPVVRRREFIPYTVRAEPWAWTGVVTETQSQARGLGPVTWAQVSNLEESADPVVTRNGFERFMFEAGPNGRCYPGGAPELAPAASAAWAAANRRGGDATTFVPTDDRGRWLRWGGAVDARLTALRPLDAEFLFPITRANNPNHTGVIAVEGQVAVSGQMRGQVTLYATGSVQFVDDLRYTRQPNPEDPSVLGCWDVLGIVSGGNIMPADNAINVPQITLRPTLFDGTPNSDIVVRSMDDADSFHTHNGIDRVGLSDTRVDGTVMALGNSWGAQNPNQNSRPRLAARSWATPAQVQWNFPTAFNLCGGNRTVRGCLYLLGSLIQRTRMNVNDGGGSNGSGYTKRYTYDRCVLRNPPPHFPVTGRFVDNAYFEHDPRRFDVERLFDQLQRGTTTP